MDKKKSATARIYVSDYATYNSGSLSGEWIDLDGKTVEEIQEEIARVQKDNTKKLGELCEEPMIQDFEGFPEGLYSESMGEKELENIVEYLELDEGDRDTLKDVLSVLGDHYFEGALSIVLNGEFTTYSGKDEVIDEWIEFHEVPDSLTFYLDEDAIIRDELTGEMYEVEDGYIKIYQ